MWLRADIAKIDHIELFVPNQCEATEWYAKVLGFEIIQEHVHWAEEGESLMITNLMGTSGRSICFCLSPTWEYP